MKGAKVLRLAEMSSRRSSSIPRPFPDQANGIRPDLEAILSSPRSRPSQGQFGLDDLPDEAEIALFDMTAVAAKVVVILLRRQARRGGRSGRFGFLGPPRFAQRGEMIDVTESLIAVSLF